MEEPAHSIQVPVALAVGVMAKAASIDVAVMKTSRRTPFLVFVAAGAKGAAEAEAAADTERKPRLSSRAASSPQYSRAPCDFALGRRLVRSRSQRATSAPWWRWTGREGEYGPEIDAPPPYWRTHTAESQHHLRNSQGSAGPRDYSRSWSSPACR